MNREGIIIGSDRHQEWLLPWWWEHYSAFNSYPVAFVDFGMSEKALAWCHQKGQCIKLPPSNLNIAFPVSVKEQWEARYGKGIWQCRPTWFKKPLALLESPFSIGLWIDLDCQIRDNLDPLFKCLLFNAEIALIQEPNFIQNLERECGFFLSEEVNYNSGVIVFHQNAPILHQWMKEIIEQNEKYVTDQHALCRAIFKYKPSLVELPLLYNWPRVLGPNPEAVIFHFCGGAGKIEIIKKGIRPLSTERDKP